MDENRHEVAMKIIVTIIRLWLELSASVWEGMACRHFLQFLGGLQTTPPRVVLCRRARTDHDACVISWKLVLYHYPRVRD